MKPVADRLAALAERGLTQIIVSAAVAAGAEILDARARGAALRLKSDASPVTEADECAERVILDALSAQFPDIPAVGEEAVSAGRAPAQAGMFFLVDPLDGTREFVAGRDEFTVNIALVSAGAPVAGVVYVPADGRLWLGDLMTDRPTARAGVVPASAAAPDVASLTPVCRSALVSRPPVALVSRSHGDPRVDAYLAHAGVAKTRPMGSSVKFCLLAEGVADLYPRFGRTMEWDTAAGDAVLRAAGGVTLDPDGAPLVYGKAGHENGNFIAWARAPTV
jgi:3'(2'), 5'-bisphosphate nucleotidase